MTLFEDSPILPILGSLGKMSLRNFNDRMRLQKQTYLAQELGYNCGFSFMWHLHGPYSSSLTKFLYAADEVGALESPQSVLSAEQNDTIARMKDLLGGDTNNPSILELYASVWYQLPNYRITGEELDSILDFLKNSKPQFTSEELSDTAKQIMDFRSNRL